MATLITTHYQEIPCSSNFENMLKSLGNVKKSQVIVESVTSDLNITYVIVRLKKHAERNSLAAHILYKKGIPASYNGPVIVTQSEDYDFMNDTHYSQKEQPQSILVHPVLNDDLWAEA